jgi:hypothetical protein
LQTETPLRPERRQAFHGYLVTAVWGLSLIVARLALDKELAVEPTWVRVAAALLPVVPTAVFLWFLVSAVRGMDELHRRVHLEALAIAYPLTILLLVTLGFLQLAINLPAEDWSYRHVFIYLPIFYFLGLAIAWRRYR